MLSECGDFFSAICGRYVPSSSIILLAMSFAFSIAIGFVSVRLSSLASRSKYADILSVKSSILRLIASAS